jgi:acyl-CoA thioesterase I
MRRVPVLLLLWMVLYAAAGPSVARAPTARTVLVLGDSLSAAHNIAADQGWVHLLDGRLKDMRPPWRVVNASISGETSLTGRNRLPDLLGQYRPCIVVLELGANDGLQGLSIEHMKDNLAAMIEASQKTGARVLLLGIELPVNYGPRYRDALRKVYVDLAAQYHTALVPFLLEGVALKPELMQADGLHPTAAGEPRVLENVWAKLHPLLEPAKRRVGKAVEH